ncbi:uncharacterized protein LOC110726246 [Chenopodium quinoa]|uniref:SHSP domain-containing protein n=1 Tax=Chenopodium quinoa TaxID=63459 RepID=A0A803M1A3_CHEQI|nr:uncharacterized protein LOC110726246 [Chenopodium quinoa]
MADFTRRRWTTPRIAVPRRGPVDEEINPSSGWTNDFPGFHCLLVNLPGFNEDDIKLNVDESGIVVVSGRRKVSDEKQEHFEKTFNVPEDGDVNNIKKIFDGATLRVRIPKVANSEENKPSSADGTSTNNINPEATKDTTESDMIPSESPAPSNGETENRKEASFIPSLGSIKEGKPVESNKEAKSPTPNNGTNGAAIVDANDSRASNSDTNEQKEIATKNKEPDNSVVSGESGDTKEKKEEPFKSPPKEEGNKEPKKGGDQEEKSSKASVLGRIAENKGILLASIISFTLGVLLSHKMHPSST